jgi:hypothetical protein
VLGVRLVNIDLKNSEKVNIFGESILSTKYVLHFSLLLSIQRVFLLRRMFSLQFKLRAKNIAGHHKNSRYYCQLLTKIKIRQ